MVKIVKKLIIFVVYIDTDNLPCHLMSLCMIKLKTFSYKLLCIFKSESCKISFKISFYFYYLSFYGYLCYTQIDDL